MGPGPLSAILGDRGVERKPEALEPGPGPSFETLGGAGRRSIGDPPRGVLIQGAGVATGRSDVDPEAVAEFFELVAVSVVGRVEVLSLGNES